MGLEIEDHRGRVDPMEAVFVYVMDRRRKYYKKLCPYYKGEWSKEEKLRMVRKCYGLEEAAEGEMAEVGSWWYYLKMQGFDDYLCEQAHPY